MERTDKEIARHLRALVNDERLRMSWSDPQNLALIQYALNERVITETGRSAFELTFGPLMRGNSGCPMRVILSEYQTSGYSH